MKRQCERDGKKKIETWEKMKKELKMRYVPTNYHQDIYLKFQYFKQQNLSVEEYSAKFLNLIIKGDLQEVEEICIAHYITGLRSDIARVIFLQPYHSLQDMMKLALKVGAQKVYENSTTTKSMAKEGFVEDSTSKNPSDAKSIPKPQVKSKVYRPHQESTTKRCYKCQGLGYIAFECPNQIVVTLLRNIKLRKKMLNK